MSHAIDLMAALRASLDRARAARESGGTTVEHELPATPITAAAHLPVSEELMADAAALRAGIDWALNATPEQWSARQAEMRRSRDAERASRVRVPLDLPRVLDGLGWSDQYAEHFVQDYCTCSQGSDGWDYCPHAYDEGLAQ